MKEEVTLDFTTMLDEAQKQLNRQFNSSANLRKYAETIMGVASVIVSFFATFKVFDNSIPKPSIFYNLFFLIAFLYAVLMILAIMAAKPFFIETPIEADLNNYIEAYADKSEKEIIASQITLYVRAIKLNEKVLMQQGRLSNIIGYFLCTIVVLILLATAALLMP
jgi:hypothetical protein